MQMQIQIQIQSVFMLKFYPLNLNRKHNYINYFSNTSLNLYIPLLQAYIRHFLYVLYNILSLNIIMFHNVNSLEIEYIIIRLSFLLFLFVTVILLLTVFVYNIENYIFKDENYGKC